MKAKFIKKPTSDELLPTDEFVIEKEIVIDNSLFQKNDYESTSWLWLHRK